jgi:hypothetical protein
MNNAGQTQGDELGWIKPLSYKSWSWIFNSTNSTGVIRYGALDIGVVPRCNSILNLMTLSGGIPGKSSGNTFGNSQTTWMSSNFLSTTWCKDALMRATIGRCRVTFPHTGEFWWTRLAAMSNMALWFFIQFIPRMTSIPCPLRMIRLVLNTLPDNSSGTF